MSKVSPDDIVIIGGGPHPTSPSATASTSPWVMFNGRSLGHAEAASLLRGIADELDDQT